MSHISRLNTKTVVVGVDVHKYSHTAAAIDCFGQKLASHQFSNDYLGGFTVWLDSLGTKENLLVALEDVNGYGCHIVKRLADEGIAMRYVPGILTERHRKQSIHREKSDPVDAERVAKVTLTNYEETLPAKESIADPGERTCAANLNFFLVERRNLVSEKTSLKNQLHALLHQYLGDHYGDGFTKAFNSKFVSYYQKRLIPGRIVDPERKALLLSIRRRLERLKLLVKQIAEIDQEMAKAAKGSEPVKALRQNITGCGHITACTLLAEVTTIKRFQTKAQFARYAGIAPIHKSSGSHNRLSGPPLLREEASRRQD